MSGNLSDGEQDDLRGVCYNKSIYHQTAANQDALAFFVEKNGRRAVIPHSGPPSGATQVK
jgi:hypothetical protein